MKISAQTEENAILTQPDFRAISAQTGGNSSSVQTGGHSISAQTGLEATSEQTDYYSIAVQTGEESDVVQTGEKSISAQTDDLSWSTQSGRNSVSVQTGWHSRTTQTGALSACAITGNDCIIDVREGSVAITAINFFWVVRAKCFIVQCWQDEQGIYHSQHFIGEKVIKEEKITAGVEININKGEINRKFTPGEYNV